MLLIWHEHMVITLLTYLINNNVTLAIAADLVW